MSDEKLRQPQIGDLAADFTLSATDGSIVTLSQQQKPLALVFLRHLA